MRVTAWNNGKHHRTGAGYGLKLSPSDRDRYFRKSWATVVVRLPDGQDVEVNTHKQSFWNDTCRELIDKQIGQWLLRNGYAPWVRGAPPCFELTPDGPARFVLKGPIT